MPGRRIGPSRVISMCASARAQRVDERLRGRGTLKRDAIRACRATPRRRASARARSTRRRFAPNRRRRRSRRAARRATIVRHARGAASSGSAARPKRSRTRRAPRARAATSAVCSTSTSGPLVERRKHRRRSGGVSAITLALAVRPSSASPSQRDVVDRLTPPGVFRNCAGGLTWNGRTASDERQRAAADRSGSRRRSARPAATRRVARARTPSRAAPIAASSPA